MINDNLTDETSTSEGRHSDTWKLVSQSDSALTWNGKGFQVQMNIVLSGTCPRGGAQNGDGKERKKVGKGGKV